MISDLILARLEAECGETFKTFGSGLDLDAMIKRKGNSGCPAVFVFMLKERGGRADTGTMVTEQERTETYSFVQMLVSRNDLTGAAAEAEVKAQRAAIHDAIFGWSPSEDYKPFTFETGDLAEIKNARVIWEDTYSTGRWVGD